MAKPIRATPCLNRIESKRLIENIKKEQKSPSKNRLQTISRALSTKFNIRD